MTETKRETDIAAAKAYSYIDYDFSSMDICYTTKENGEALCSCVYAYENGIAVIKYLASKDFEGKKETEKLTLMAVLNEADTGGVTRSICFFEGIFPLLKSCLYREEMIDGEMALSLELEGYFDCKDLNRM